MPDTSTGRSSAAENPKPGTAAERLLAWYERNQRDLPWRHDRDPFRIWISEIMLQQTRVETVMPYYVRFLERFPTVEDLAAADMEEVLGLWSGLGYYRRARNLHRAARQIVASGGRMPEDFETLSSLPGVGRYTAAAIASIAFGQSVPAIDGNIQRVVARVRGIEGDPRRGEARKRIDRAARQLMAPGHPGDSNQALMELGATVCRPRSPRCEVCPLAIDCVAQRSRDPEAFPTPRVRPKTVRVERSVAVVRDGGRVLLVRRDPEDRLLPGMWELPWTDRIGDGEAADRLAERYGGEWSIETSVGEVRHAITHRTFRIEILEARLLSGSAVAEGPEVGWFDEPQLDSLPMSSMVRKVLAQVAAVAE